MTPFLVCVMRTINICIYMYRFFVDAVCLFTQVVVSAVLETQLRDVVVFEVWPFRTYKGRVSSSCIKSVDSHCSLLKGPLITNPS